MSVPFLDLGAAYRELQRDIDAAVSRVLASGWYILGPEVEAFEEEFAEFCGTRHAVGVANGLDALVLALRALDIGNGDEVIVPSNTFVATWLAVSAVGARPVPVEPDPGTHNIDAARIEAAISSGTRAIMPVHLYGQPVDLDPVLDVAGRHGLAVIEDAAQAHGARYKGKRIGGHGDIVCWSFYPGKNLGALGDGGGVTTNRDDLAERVRLLRNYGSREKYLNEAKGVNSRLDPLQAAILRVKLAHLDEWNARRSRIAERYIDALADCGLGLPYVPQWADPAWHLFVVRAAGRSELRGRLDAAGITTLIHYPVAPHEQSAYADLGYRAEEFPIAHALSREVLSLPIGPHLGPDDVESVVAALRVGQDATTA